MYSIVQSGWVLQSNSFLKVMGCSQPVTRIEKRSHSRERTKAVRHVSNSLKPSASFNSIGSRKSNFIMAQCSPESPSFSSNAGNTDHQLAAYSYVLPDDRVAQNPVTPRDSAKLLVVNERHTHQHCRFRDLVRSVTSRRFAYPQ